MLLLRHDWKLWHRVLAADYSETTFGKKRSYGDVAGSAALRRSLHHAASEQLAFRPHARTALARGDTCLRVRIGACLCGCLPREPGNVPWTVCPGGPCILWFSTCLMGGTPAVLKRVGSTRVNRAH